MGNPSPHIERWSFATFGEHFRVQKDAVAAYTDLRIKYEGHDEPPEEEGQWMEVRMDGPWSREIGGKEWIFRAEVNILVSTIMTDTDFHAHPELVGHVRSWFIKCIPLRRFGDGPNDDQGVVGQYKLDTNFRNQVLVANFGQVDPKIRLVQSTIEGHYELREVF